MKITQAEFDHIEAMRWEDMTKEQIADAWAFKYEALQAEMTAIDNGWRYMYQTLVGRLRGTFGADSKARRFAVQALEESREKKPWMEMIIERLEAIIDTMDKETKALDT